MIDNAGYDPAFLSWLDAPVAALDQISRNAAQARQMQLTKPQGALGDLERLAVRLAGMQGRACPGADRVSIAVFAADHGVAAEGVSAYPQAVTGQMIVNFSRGGAAISVAAKALDAHLRVYNLGTVTALEPLAGVEDQVIAPQTGNLAREAAMTQAQLVQAMNVGRLAVEQAQAREAVIDIFIGGEMGIGNTTPATALAAALMGLPVTDLVGPGTGIDGAGIARKVAVIERALALHKPQPVDPLEMLRCLGGFEIAALCGAYLQCAQQGVPVLVDGFICTVAALLGCRLQPQLGDWLLFSHCSAEPGYARLLDHLPSFPLLDLGMRLGEGSGAAVAIPLLRMACTLHAQMSTFEEAAVSGASL
ncbi:Nicotinate-nucleotide--dimethylbenzimidazole phosphoribosyltransferase [Marinobacterium lacunae]|uniref:Nicotinate-nucleotide--dimethylbenzimidazole phosphoribosyltransferase n=1 Tax=Marinobacterium lacunae TaxID=1232683 RepID=A0A081G2W9_9GAMM|nr:nicotinate-nucleotide--dimethylbenzimidazole phosphoribosyltransferase [Marinobacterium lacunae]KEA65124.1 Nicotinate-nucleotide--dimethylbenzimidazole phosphoribosyltransferase [Marinobacterium lacunae]